LDLMQRGYRMMSYNHDMGLLGEALSSGIQALKG